MPLNFFFFKVRPNSYSNFSSVCTDAVTHCRKNFSEFGNMAVWFQQDGITVHMARRSMKVLRELSRALDFITLYGLLACIFFRSCALRHFSMGDLKFEVYKHQSRTINEPRMINELKAVIRQEIVAKMPGNEKLNDARAS